MSVLIKGGQLIVEDDKLVGKPGDGKFVKRARSGEEFPGTSGQRPLRMG